MHISDIKKYTRCPRLYGLAQQSESSYFSYFNVNTDVVASVSRKLNIEWYNTGSANQTNEDSFAMLERNPWLFRGRFEADGLRIKVPLMHCVDNHATLYSVLLSTGVNHDEYLSIRYNIETLNKVGITVDDVLILYLNEDYVRQGALDHKQLWKIADHYRDMTILEYCLTLDVDLDKTLDEMKQYELQPAIRTSKCYRANRCSYYDTCFPQEKDLPANSIMNLVSSEHKREMFAKGILYLQDADEKLLEGNRVQYAQIMADRNGGLYAEQLALNNWLDNAISYPISYIDFEWDLYPIPPYEGMKPMDVSVFQYSLHVDDGKELKHYEFVGEGDCRQKLVESMLANLPSEGSVFAYNAKGAEKLRIREFARYFPQYADQLLNINERMYDLADPFISGLVYDTRMAGSFTLKTIEEMIDEEHSYHELDVSNGIEAVEIHRLLEQCDDLKDRETYFEQLYKYCGLDSYSLYKVLNWLQKIRTERK